MKVISIVGPSGSGKSTLINYLQSQHSLFFVEEDYINSKSLRFSNKEIISKWCWINNWFNKIVEYKKNDIILTDRCPLEVIPYANNGHYFKSALLESFSELKRYNIQIYTVYLSVPFDICLERISKRIIDEPIRQEYNELDILYQQKIHLFYENDKDKLWNYRINCGNLDIEEIAKHFITIYKTISNEFFENGN